MKSEEQKAIDKYGETIHGWDDGSIFFTDGLGNNHVVQLNDELMQNIIVLCRVSFENNSEISKDEFEEVATTLYSEQPFLNHAMTGRYIELCLENFSTPFQAMVDALPLLKKENEKRLEQILRVSGRRSYFIANDLSHDSFRIVKEFAGELNKRLYLDAPIPHARIDFEWDFN